MHCQRIASGKAVSTSGSRAAAPARAAPPRRRAADVRVRVQNAEKALFGEDFGARDPYAAELESNFGEKVLGNWNTDHIIKPPDALGKVIGLAARALPPAAELSLLSEFDRERLRQQVPGWRVVAAAGAAAAAGSAGAAIQQEWAVKDAACAARLVDSIRVLAEEQGHAPESVESVGGTTVVARLSTAALGGLTEADFIVAAKINSLDIKELLPQRKQRFWA
ncbi:hypothetical protein Rsub_06704 [Raphidocelis subcapitata]|uniref:4a-hydroxytetrahydrobiopterin dehydratase n=1 Tax=Raphidocelis subcapitata TaxID=307507 RepID=A0A2V0P4T9_9CHLO|nr:hypothetical protein Rsub_06704 [Raphidocelis subcapitata]|eukprot:GBF94589.1 hypothetical protein Rsub_06704 [Raphidocelis subcapitata]